jgi:ABC-type microcin C transport system permease subunit YejE
MFRHLLPNAMVATLTFLPFILSGSITTLTALDFLGFGLPPGSASLGELLAQGKANLQAPWLGLTGFITISVMLSLLIFIGEACATPSIRERRSHEQGARHTAVRIAICRWPSARAANVDGGRPHLL